MSVGLLSSLLRTHDEAARAREETREVQELFMRVLRDLRHGVEEAERTVERDHGDRT